MDYTHHFFVGGVIDLMFYFNIYWIVCWLHVSNMFKCKLTPKKWGILKIRTCLK
jgi:hypothetical protein